MVFSMFFHGERHSVPTSFMIETYPFSQQKKKHPLDHLLPKCHGQDHHAPGPKMSG
jgi:hypothetical protein